MKLEILKVDEILKKDLVVDFPKTPYVWFSFHKDRRKNGYRVVFKNMEKSEALVYLVFIANNGIDGWELYENKQQGKFGIKKYFGKLI